MSKKRFFRAAVLAAGIGLTTTAYQAPPLLLVEDENGVVEQPAPSPNTTTQEQDETLIIQPKSASRTSAKPANTQPATNHAGGLVLVDEDAENQSKAALEAYARYAEEYDSIKQATDAAVARREAELRQAQLEAEQKAKEEAARIKKAQQDSIKAAKEEAKRIEKARQDSIKAAKAETIRIEKIRQDSIRAARQDSIRAAREAIRIEKARQDSIQQAHEAAIREQARLDSIRAAQEEAIRIEKARQDSIQKAHEAAILEQARQDSIQKAQEAERIRIEELVRQDSIMSAREEIYIVWADSVQKAQAAEKIRIERDYQDSILMAQAAERIRIEQARQDSIRNAQKENEKQTNAAVQVYVAPAASAPAQNTQSDDLNSKMLEALQRAYEEALKQANKSDSIQILKLKLEQELERLKEQQAALDARKKKEQEEKEAAALVAQAAAQQQEAAAQPEKETVFTRYYKHSGRNMLSILSVGYSTYFQVGQAVAAGASPTEDAFKRHILNFELFEWRAKCFGMQMFNFETGLNTPFVSEENPEQNRYLFERGGYYLDERVEATAKTMWFAYKPAVKFYIPCTKWLAVELYGGAEVDLTKMWSKINSAYYTGYHNETNQDGLRIPEQNFFVGAYGGAGFMLTAVPQVPLEIKAEYRHPVKGNTALVPQGVYISAQLHLASPIKK